MAQQGVGIPCGQALVEQVMLELGMGLLQRRREGLRLFGLWAQSAVRMQRVADHDNLDLVLAQEASDGFQVGTKIRAVQRKQRLRGHAERVRDGQADALITNIQSESAEGWHTLRIVHRLCARWGR